MKCCFIHGTKFKKNEDGILSTGGSYSEEVWKRYTDIFEDFTVLARCQDIKDKYILKNFNVFNVKNKKFIKLENINSIRGYIKNKIKTVRIIKENVKNTDFGIIRLPDTYGNIAIKYFKKYNIPYLIELVACPWDTLWNYSFKGKIIAPYMCFKTKKILKDAKYVIYITKKFLQKRYPSNCKQIVCSNVLISNFDDNNLHKRLDELKHNKNKYTIGTIANVDVKYKGQKYVIKALSKLKEKGYNLEYQLIGGGNRKRLEKFAKKYNVIDNVKFLGSVPHNEIFRYLDNIDIYIQPSNAEAQGRALVEAMSRACACICSNVGGMPEIVDKNNIFKKRNYKDLALKIEDVILNIRETSVISYEKSKEFDIEKTNQKRKKFFLQIKQEILEVSNEK